MNSLNMDNEREHNNDDVKSNISNCKCKTNRKSDIKIDKLVNKTGCIEGGDQITLLGYNFKSRYCIIIYMWENVNIHENTKEDKTNVIWEASIKPDDIFHHSAITFRSPKYGGKWKNERTPSTNCFIQVKRTCDNKKSNIVVFTYVNTLIRLRLKRPHSMPIIHDMQNMKLAERKTIKIADSTKAKICKQEPSSSQSSNKLTVSQIVKHLNDASQCDIKKIDMLESWINYYADLHEDGNTIFHDSLKSGDFLKIYVLKDKFKIKNLCCTAVNILQETVLHYACKLNKSEYIRALINMGSAIHTQDVYGRTPLHIAIAENQQNCIKYFQQIFQNPKFLPSDRQNELTHLFSVYDRFGHTVLHLAVLHDLRELVVDMLKYCKSADIDACRIEILGNGNTILHLAVLKGLNEMVTAILEQVPNACNYTNYAGSTVLDLDLKKYLDSKTIDCIESCYMTETSSDSDN